MVKINQSGGSASVILVVILLLLIIGGGGAAYYISSDDSKTKEEDEKAKEKKELARLKRKEAKERQAELDAEEAAMCEGVDCGDNGSCGKGDCICDDGWTGDNCEEEVVEEEEEEFSMVFDSSGRQVTPEPTPDETTGTCAETRELEPTIPKGLSEALQQQWRTKSDHISFYKYEDNPEKKNVCGPGGDTFSPEWSACERDKWMNTRYNLPGNKHSWIQGAHYNWITMEMPVNGDLQIVEQIALEKWINEQCKYHGSVDDMGNPIQNSDFKECDQYSTDEIDGGECDRNPACYQPVIEESGDDPVCRKKLVVRCPSDIYGQGAVDNGVDNGDDLGVSDSDINTDGVIIEDTAGKNKNIFTKSTPTGSDDYFVELTDDIAKSEKVTVPDTGDLTNAEIYYGMNKGEKWSDLEDGSGTHISRDYMNSYIKTVRSEGSNPMVDPGSTPIWIHLCSCSAGGNPFTNCLCKSATYLDTSGSETGKCSVKHTTVSETSSEGYTCCLYNDDNPCHDSSNQSQPVFSDTQGGGGINSLLNALHIGDFYNFDNPFCNIKGGNGKVKGLVYPSNPDEKKEWINKCCPSCSYKRFKDVGIPNEIVSGQRNKCGRDVYFKYIKKATEELKTKYSKEKDKHERTKAQEWEYLNRYLKVKSGCFKEDSEAVLCGDGIVREDKCNPCRSTEDDPKIPRNEKYNPTKRGCKSILGSSYRSGDDDEGTNCTPPPFEGPHLCPLVPDPSRIADGTCSENWVPSPSPAFLPKSLERNVVDEPKLPTYEDIIKRAIEMANDNDDANNDKCEDIYEPSHNKYYGIEDNGDKKVAYTGMGKLITDKNGVIRAESEVPSNLQIGAATGFDDAYIGSEEGQRFNYDAYNDKNAPTQGSAHNSQLCSETSLSDNINWKNCKIPDQPQLAYKGGRLWPSNVFAEGDNVDGLSGKWTQYSTSVNGANKLSGGEINNDGRYLDESNIWIPNNVTESAGATKYEWSLSNFAGHNDIDSECKTGATGDNQRILGPNHIDVGCGAKIDSANKHISYKLAPTFGPIGIGYQRGGSNYLNTTRGGAKPSTGLNNVVEQMRIALRRRPWSDNFRNGVADSAFLPSGYNSRSPFYLMSNTNNETINHRGLLSESPENFASIGADDMTSSEDLTTLGIFTPDPGCETDQCGNEASYGHMRDNMSQCQRTHFLGRNEDVPVARELQTRKSYGNSLAYTGLLGVYTGATTAVGDGKDVRWPRAAPYTLPGVKSNFNAGAKETSPKFSGHGAKRVGANRVYKDQYYKMLSTKEGKPEGMWFRKNDFVLYDFKNRYTLDRHYGAGRSGQPKETAVGAGNNNAAWHWDNSGYNWKNGNHVDGVGSGALHQTGLKKGNTIPHRVLEATGDLPKTIAMSSYSTSSGKLNGWHYAHWHRHYMANAECNIPMMWNGKEYPGARGSSWSWGGGGHPVQSACYTQTRDEDWYKRMSGKGYHN